MPSYEEPFGMIFLEAMAMKRPIVALANGGTPEVVDHGKGGLLSEPGDIEALAGNILTLIRDKPLRESMGAYNRKRVEEYFTPQRMANDVERVYQEILGLGTKLAEQPLTSTALSRSGSNPGSSESDHP